MSALDAERQAARRTQRAPRPRCRIKTCGMFRLEDVFAVNAARPDYCGFVVCVPGARRSVDERTACELAASVDDGIGCVAVLVDADVGLAAELAATGAFRALQLHGHEDEPYLSRLRQRSDIPLVKAFSVRTEDDVERARASTADLVLLDSGGGTGRTFDWQLVRGFDRPFALAGGLNPQNVAHAIRSVRPWAVDLSSGLETEGFKDPEKIAAAVRAVRALDKEDQ